MAGQGAIGTRARVHARREATPHHGAHERRRRGVVPTAAGCLGQLALCVVLGVALTVGVIWFMTHRTSAQSAPAHSTAIITAVTHHERDDAERVGMEQIGAWTLSDEKRLAALEGQWVPQLGSYELRADATTVAADRIVDAHRPLRGRHDAIIVRGEHTSYARDDLYLTLVPEGFATPDAALAWCADRGLTTSAACVAWRVDTDPSGEPQIRLP